MCALMEAGSSSLEDRWLYFNSLPQSHEVKYTTEQGGRSANLGDHLFTLAIVHCNHLGGRRWNERFLHVLPTICTWVRETLGPEWGVGGLGMAVFLLNSTHSLRTHSSLSWSKGMNSSLGVSQVQHRRSGIRVILSPHWHVHWMRIRPIWTGTCEGIVWEVKNRRSFAWKVGRSSARGQGDKAVLGWAQSQRHGRGVLQAHEEIHKATVTPNSSESYTLPMVSPSSGL